MPRETKAQIARRERALRAAATRKRNREMRELNEVREKAAYEDALGTPCQASDAQIPQPAWKEDQVYIPDEKTLSEQIRDLHLQITNLWSTIWEDREYTAKMHREYAEATYGDLAKHERRLRKIEQKLG